MRLLFASLVILSLAVIIAVLAQYDSGYVLIQLRGWSIELSFVLLAVLLLLAFILLYVGLRLFSGSMRLPQRLRGWRARRRERKAKTALARGFLDLIEGRWDRAEQRLLRYAGEEAGMLGFLGAARAAQEQGADQRRDRYLELACKSMPNAEFALSLAQAEMQIAHADYPSAAANLRRLQGIAPRNRIVLTLLMRLYLQTEDWERLIELVPSLRRQRVLEPERVRRVEQRAYIGLLEAPGHDDEYELAALWRRTPNDFREAEEVVKAYVRRLLQCGASARAEEVLHDAINRRWDPTQVYLFGLVEGADPAAQVRRAESWLRGREQDPVLLLTLGRLCRRKGLWGKARQYLEACVKTATTPEAFNELAATLEAMGETDAALKYYRRGLQAHEVEAHRLAATGADPQRLLPSP